MPWVSGAPITAAGPESGMTVPSLMASPSPRGVVASDGHLPASTANWPPAPWAPFVFASAPPLAPEQPEASRASVAVAARAPMGWNIFILIPFDRGWPASSDSQFGLVVPQRAHRTSSRRRIHLLLLTM